MSTDLEPSDDVIADLQSEVVRQRTEEGADPLPFHPVPKSQFLSLAARSLRTYEALKKAGQ